MSRTVMLGWALAASLALNAGLAGYMLGAGGPHGGDRPPKGREMLRTLAEPLSAQGKAVLRETARSARPRIREARRAARAARENMIGVMRASPEDADAIAAAMLRVREANADMQAQIQRIPLAVLLQLNEDDRNAFVDALNRNPLKRR